MQHSGWICVGKEPEKEHEKEEEEKLKEEEKEEEDEEKRGEEQEAALVRLGKGRSRGLGDRGGRDRRQSREAPTLNRSSLEKSPNLL